MKALILQSFNATYQYTEIDTPVAGNGQVLVKIAASGVNPLDIKIKTGQAEHAKPHLPGVFGLDMAGTVAAVGPGVERFKTGDEVYGMTGGINGIQGTLAEFAAVDADLLAIKPKNLHMREAAALPLVFITAWEALVDRATIKENQNILIHGGAGGIGHIAVQLAKAFGANVFATGNAAQAGIIAKYGAVPVNYETTTVDEYVNEYTHGEGFDVVLDTIGGATLDASFRAVKQYTGHVVSSLGWGTHSIAPLSFKGATYSGVFALYPLISGKQRKKHGEILSEATKLIEAGKLKPMLDPAIYRLDSVEMAYQQITEGRARGKVVISV